MNYVKKTLQSLFLPLATALFVATMAVNRTFR
jgi:hypothetical protein